MNKANQVTKRISSRNLYALLGQIGKVLLSGIFFFILARVLGPNQFGEYVTVLASTAIFNAFLDLGFGHLIIKETANNGERFNQYYGNSIIVILFNGVLIVGVILLINSIFLDISLVIVMFVILNELFLFKIVDLNSKSFQAHENIKVSSLLIVAIGFSKLAAVTSCLILFKNGITLTQFLITNTILFLILLIISTSLVFKSFGTPRFKINLILENVKEGLSFSIGGLSKTVYVDIDKIMLTRLVDSSATGLYSLAYKLITLAYIPVQSILYSRYTSFFKAGSKGIDFALKETKSVLKFSLPYGIIVSLIILIMSPSLSFFMGSSYQESELVLRYLMVIPLLQSIYYPFADAITGLGFQRIRSIIQVSAVFINVILNLVLIPYYSWKGAAIATIITEIYLFIIIITYTILLRRKR